MKTGYSIKRSQPDRERVPVETTEADFERILEWARLYAAQLRGAAGCAEKHRQALAAKGETGERLRSFADGRRSKAFTKREKAAFGLCESISLKEPEKGSSKAFQEARGCFRTAEMVCLTLAITAVNDWVNLHSNPAIRVLVVEDDPHDQELFRIQLRQAQMEKNITFVSSGSEVLELLTGPGGELFRKDLVAIFLDLHLPGMNGIELLRHIRALKGMEDFPVIVMTSSTRPQDREECRKLKVASYVGKPVTYSSFSNAVAGIFD